MKIQEIIEKLDLTPLTNVEDKDVEGVFISDMLSDVMASASAGDLWLTVQTHKNIISATNLIDIAAVVITYGKNVPRETIDLANRFHVVILSTPMSTFQMAGELYSIGLQTA